MANVGPAHRAASASALVTALVGSFCVALPALTGDAARLEPTGTSARSRTPISPAPVPPLRAPDQDYYFETADGAKLAVSVWLPTSPGPARRVPAILYQTRYGRQSANAANNIRSLPEHPFAVVVVEVRGTTVSSGDRLLEINAEAGDMSPLVAHLASQPWSDGRFLTSGQSYLADTADVATGQQIDAVRGALVRQSEFDVFSHALQPGGIQNRWALEEYDRWTLAMDTGRFETPDHVIDCPERAADCAELGTTVTAVWGDEGLVQLRKHMTGRRRWRAADFADVVSRDEPSRNGYSFFDWSPARWLQQMRSRAAPVQYWGSWLDAGTAEAALARYRSTPNAAVEVWITSNDHTSTQLTDPLRPQITEPVPAWKDQQAIMLRFVNNVFNDVAPSRMIHYYILGDGGIRSTPAWPPAGVRDRVLYLGPDHSLAEKRPQPRLFPYPVDFTATSGPRTRWTANLGFPAEYGNRAALAQRLASFDSSPLTTDVELAGYVRVHLKLATQTRDPALHVYLDDIAPDGRVSYLTEGLLRLVHRRQVARSKLPYDQGPDRHSYASADVQFMRPGVPVDIDLAMQPIAARLRIGHRVRLSIAGADATNFARYSGGQPDTFSVYLGVEATRIELPLRPWAESAESLRSGAPLTGAPTFMVPVRTIQ